MSGGEVQRDVRRWMRFAREDIEAAEALVAEGGAVPRHVCWLAQQAAEKALKAALTFEQSRAKHRHDLDALRTELPEGWRVKTSHPDLAELTQFAVEARYPGDWPEATSVDAERAVVTAREVYDQVAEDLTERGFLRDRISDEP